jgi:predicted protein tyrosine phosphatase
MKRLVPALALAIFADWLGEGRETQAVSELLRVARLATPNRLVVNIADKLLNREGRLIVSCNQVMS